MALIGAGGYVGARIIEKSILLGSPTIVPIVRSWRSQGRLARYGIRTFMSEVSDTESLVPLLRGCGMAVNLTMGENNVMLRNVKALHEACAIAGVPILVHVSSAEVFGRAKEQNLKEDSSPRSRHWMEYARAKRETESWLRSQFQGPVKIVILRPGLIWGPGSGWLVQPAKALSDGTAFLFNEGLGICNLIHVDNFIQHLVHLAAQEKVDSGIFNVSDTETLNWLEYYSAIASEIGIEASRIHLLPDSAFKVGYKHRLEGLARTRAAKVIKSRMTSASKVRIKQLLEDKFRSPKYQVIDPKERLPVTRDLWWIQGTKRKLPTRDFATRYPGIELKPFAELMTSAGDWLRFAGFGESDVHSLKMKS